MSNYRERREAGHYEPGATPTALEPELDEAPLVDDEDEDETEPDEPAKTLSTHKTS